MPRGISARLAATVIAAAAVGSGLVGPAAAPAGAVTFGRTVARPTVSAPWVISIFAAGGGSPTPVFICSGTALSAREVLTAAHCVAPRGLRYFVKVGADRLSGGRLVAVAGVSRHSGYRPRSVVHDIAVVRTRSDLGLRSYPRLADPATMTGVRGSRPPGLVLFGWGNNHTGRLPGTLSYARLSPQTRAAQRAFGRLFRPHLMVAAGRHLPASNAYAGGCNGDSGAPLIMTARGLPHVVGVVSFGKEGCNVKAPTVFTSVGDYAGWIVQARRQLR